MLHDKVKEIELEINDAQDIKVPPSIFANALEFADEYFKEGCKEYFEKLMDKKLVSCVQLDWDFFTNVKFGFSHVVERMNYRELFGVRCNVYPNQVSYFMLI